MKSLVASVRPVGGLDRVNRALQSLEDEWQRHGEVSLEQFWTGEVRRDAVDHGDSVGLLSELVKADLRRRFGKGESPTVAEYLERFPELRAANSRVLSLVYEEYCLNEECGTAPEVESFCNRYADWKSSLVSQLQYHRLFSHAAGRRPSLPPFPEVGQDFEEFRLQSLLGAGGMSRVFLARDLSLGGKQVVLKVTLDRGQEPKVQGPLDHPHIVPVNSVAYQTDGCLCGLSMPYRPGLTLDGLIPLVDPGSRPRKAIALWEGLVRGTRDAVPPDALGELESLPDVHGQRAIPRGDGWDGFPVRGSYAQGVAWIIMILARALHYAHRRHTFHRDVKPGNLLLTLQNGPQLLDFNLAESPHSANHAQSALHGGTLPYMAPEQIEAFLNPELWGDVGARADVYSLGLVLRELLTGQKPELPDERLPPARALRAVLDRRPFLDPTVRQYNTAIPHSLEAIVAKCLAFAPADRYPDAQTLEHDLDRFLKHLPIQQSANPSRRERLGNWLIRNRRVLAGAACTIVVASALYGLWHSRPVVQVVRPKIESSSVFLDAVRDVNAGKFDLAIGHLTFLEREDTQSCLVKFYLSLAQNDDLDKQSDSDRYLLKALAAPDAEYTLMAWSKDHPEVTTYLVDFADTRIQRADSLADQLDNKNSVPDPVRDRAYRQPAYELARDALLLAEKLDPASPKIQRLLARCERIFGDYDSAYTRLSVLIARRDSAGTLDGRSLLYCWRLRVWVAFLWAERELRERVSVNERTLARLQEAKADLDRSDRCLKEWPDDDLKVRQRTEYHALHDRLRTLVTSARVELELSLVVKAGEDTRRAEKVLVRLVEFIGSNNLNGKVPNADDWAKPLAELKDKLKLVQGHAQHKTEIDDSPPDDRGSNVASSGDSHG
jgi:serine/threonine protein kinase